MYNSNFTFLSTIEEVVIAKYLNVNVFAIFICKSNTVN